ncbi:MAG TPA: hydrogenase maturation nickel metallochaperone HypA [Syntrophomonas sp.]|nr:hydrogenase maturation nickel metallochaperone HypA [Syntrophomonas sp.]HRW13156.1 hydrogenase maturation nickel metallochaperone HypA [Syntrophomonas sp.]
MHELPVIDSILNIVLRHAANHQVQRVVSITLQVGAMSDLEDEWMQRYFDQLSQGTVAEAAVLKINRIPVVFACPACGHEFEIFPHVNQAILCPQCGRDKGFTLLSGREYHIKEMEVI